MNYSNYSIIMVDDGNNGNGSGNDTLIDDSNTTPYNERVIIVLMYFGVSLLFVIPILMCLLCFYKMRGNSPCNLKEACCCTFC